ncbi:hypothetical protein [Microbacterium trichothecenolyticum]|uniref:Uncharacterized protein n=1 Tax=Microbacterium trichothecenolyticum TaxID=69370 RepID=A0ABU0TQ91_MICTR|nr:hypothetical protein [Microbacterium trichothecenolyticum]MDQ1121820.1 hypothetical protein [Microbacterium trichothecenolyticum]
MHTREKLVISSNLTVGGPFVKDVFAALGLTKGARYRVTARRTATSPVTITVSAARGDSTVVQSTASEPRPSRPLDAVRRLRVFSIIDGSAGVRGGVTTASAYLVEAFNQTAEHGSEGEEKFEWSHDVEAWNVLLNKQSGHTLRDRECYAFSAKFREILADAQSPDTLVWVIGHTRFSGEEAEFIQDEFNAVSAVEGAGTEPTVMRRMHMVHMSPTQTAAARARAGAAFSSPFSRRVRSNAPRRTSLFRFPSTTPSSRSS